MGEAKRKRLNGSVHHHPQEPHYFPIPEDLKCDIAASVRSVEIRKISMAGGAPETGDCLFRTLSGVHLMLQLGLDCHIQSGGLIYRVGQDEMRDVIAFGADPQSRGAMIGNRMAGHLWLRLGDEVIDFSVGDWPRIGSELERSCTPQAELALGPPRWEIEPPQFSWKHLGELRPTLEEWAAGLRTPELGHAWYTGWIGPQPPLDRWLADYKVNFMPMMKMRLATCIEHYKLRDRIAAARAGRSIAVPPPPRALVPMEMIFPGA